MTRAKLRRAETPPPVEILKERADPDARAWVLAIAPIATERHPGDVTVSEFAALRQVSMATASRILRDRYLRGDLERYLVHGANRNRVQEYAYRPRETLG